MTAVLTADGQQVPVARVARSERIAALAQRHGALAVLLLAVLVAALVFALAHTYQGALGAAATALVALGFTALFVASNSIWLPIAVHALIDLRVLVLWRGDSRLDPTPGPDETPG